MTTGKDGGTTFPVVDNGIFYVLRDYRIDNEKIVDLALEEHIVTEVRTDRECCSAQITVKGFIDGKPVWTARKKASRGEMFDRFYRTATPGCCGTATRYAYFDPLTGTQGFIATEPLVSLGMVGTYALSRYLALNRLSEPGDEQFGIQIRYGPQSGPSQITYLTVDGQDSATYSVTVQYLKDGKLENSTLSYQGGTYPRDFTRFPPNYPSNTEASADDLTGFSFVLNVEDRKPIKIPVVKDRLDLKSVSLPKGFRLSDTIPTGFAEWLERERQ